MELLSPKMDFIFKQIFEDSSKKEVIISFLNAILNPTKENIIINVLFRPNDSYLKLKMEVITKNKKKMNIEIQINSELSIPKNVLYYCENCNRSLLEDDNILDLHNKTIYINILNFAYLDDYTNFHTIFKVKEEYKDLTDIVEIHFIEFPKFKGIKNKTQLTSWCEFLNNPISPKVRELEREITEIEMAMDTLVKLNSDEKQRRIYEIREKRFFDERSAINTAIKGNQKREKLRIAKNLLDILDDETIALKTELKIEEIKKLRKENSNSLKN
ncbi:Rpn family recombination-promoting nuclease/putative transposase [Clostridium sp.]|uniref:Rpn family recombination-promoting nuclease/putative transposase n=1 Tax=Clostridium sp. TaxID=1506 RepID=UPI003995546B